MLGPGFGGSRKPNLICTSSMQKQEGPYPIINVRVKHTTVTAHGPEVVGNTARNVLVT